jgi:hypothetical protein
MGPGHLGIGLAAKPAAPRVPLWVLLVASETLDLLSFGFLAIGWEKTAVIDMDFRQGLSILTPASIPWSHGLLMSIVWSVAAGMIAYLFFRDKRVGGIIGFVVFSHWILDFIVHLPDLPLLFTGSPLVGLGLWGSGPGLILSLILEIVLLTAGIAVYLSWRKKKFVKEAI